MHNNKQQKIKRDLPFIIFISIFLIIITIWLYYGNKEIEYNIDSIKINGTVKSIGFFPGQSGSCLLIDTTWYYILDYKIESEVQVGDKVLKELKSSILKVINNQREIKNYRINRLYLISEKKQLSRILAYRYESDRKKKKKFLSSVKIWPPSLPHGVP